MDMEIDFVDIDEVSDTIEYDMDSLPTWSI